MVYKTLICYRVRDTAQEKSSIHHVNHPPHKKRKIESHQIYYQNANNNNDEDIIPVTYLSGALPVVDNDQSNNLHSNPLSSTHSRSCHSETCVSRTQTIRVTHPVIDAINNPQQSVSANKDFLSS